MSSLRSLHPSPLVEQAIEHLRERIASGQWPVGTKLPGETTLAASLGVGRSTVREALRALAGAGLVRPRQGAGVFVIADRQDDEWPARLRRAALTDVYEVRAMLEVQAARLAAVRRTPEDVAALEAALAVRTVAARQGGAPFIDADIALHSAVVAAAHNPVLVDLFAEFTPRLREGLLDLLEMIDVPAHDADHGGTAHAELVEAVKSQDANRAGSVLLTELRTTQEHFKAATREAGRRTAVPGGAEAANCPPGPGAGSRTGAGTPANPSRGAGTPANPSGGTDTPANPSGGTGTGTADSARPGTGGTPAAPATPGAAHTSGRHIEPPQAEAR